MIPRLMRLRIIVPLVVIGLVGLCLVSWFLGESHALGALTVRHATPDELGTAMNADQFYSNYREDSLVVAGPVTSVATTGSRSTLTFTTHGAFGTQCQLPQGQPTIHAGDVITVVAEGYSAQRLSWAVLLTSCMVVVAP